MGKDTTGGLARKFTDAFMAQGAGACGAAGRQAAAVGYVGNGGAGGAEPIPFERMCEIAGAMGAWAKSGQDVNALLHRELGMTALDYSNVSTWWFTHMTADLRKLEAYERQYMGPQTRHDADIAF